MYCNFDLSFLNTNNEPTPQTGYLHKNNLKIDLDNYYLVSPCEHDLKIDLKQLKLSRMRLYPHQELLIIRTKNHATCGLLVIRITGDIFRNICGIYSINEKLSLSCSREIIHWIIQQESLYFSSIDKFTLDKELFEELNKFINTKKFILALPLADLDPAVEQLRSFYNTLYRRNTELEAYISDYLIVFLLMSQALNLKNYDFINNAINNIINVEHDFILCSLLLSIKKDEILDVITHLNEEALGKIVKTSLKIVKNRDKYVLYKRKEPLILIRLLCLLQSNASSIAIKENTRIFLASYANYSSYCEYFDIILKSKNKFILNKLIDYLIPLTDVKIFDAILEKSAENRIYIPKIYEEYDNIKTKRSTPIFLLKDNSKNQYYELSKLPSFVQNFLLKYYFTKTISYAFKHNDLKFITDNIDLFTINESTALLKHAVTNGNYDLTEIILNSKKIKPTSAIIRDSNKNNYPFITELLVGFK